MTVLILEFLHFIVKVIKPIRTPINSIFPMPFRLLLTLFLLLLTLLLKDFIYTFIYFYTDKKTEPYFLYEMNMVLFSVFLSSPAAGHGPDKKSTKGYPRKRARHDTQIRHDINDRKSCHKKYIPSEIGKTVMP